MIAVSTVELMSIRGDGDIFYVEKYVRLVLGIKFVINDHGIVLFVISMKRRF